MVSFSGLIVVLFTAVIYFVIAVYIFHALEAFNDRDFSPNIIASISFVISMLGSSVTSGAFLGRIAPSHPASYAAVVGSSFMLLQLWQMALLQGIPLWLSTLSILSYPPCCVYAAMRVSGSSPPKVHTAPPDSAATTALEATAADAPAALSPSSAPPGAAAPPPPSAAGAAGDAPTAAAQPPDAAGGGADAAGGGGGAAE
jgi:hypothetical protein